MNEKLTQSIEDYIETIYLNYSKEWKGVRVTDLATAMKVTKASANDAVRKLKEMGYVEHERYGQIYLTEDGKAKGMAIYEKHCLIMHFLTDVLKVSAPVAEEDACNIEHIISDETFEKLKGFLNAD
ncbi:MAG: metal-dependent transcriptional regulator [Eubacterium aggregans]